MSTPSAALARSHRNRDRRKLANFLRRQHRNLKRREVPMREEIAMTWSPRSGEFYCGGDAYECEGRRCGNAVAAIGAPVGQFRVGGYHLEFNPESVNRGRLRPMCGVWADQLRANGRNER